MRHLFYWEYDPKHPKRVKWFARCGVAPWGLRNIAETEEVTCPTCKWVEAFGIKNRDADVVWVAE